MLMVTKDGQSHPLHPQVPLETPQQFHDWFALIDRSITYSQESHFRSHLMNVESQLASCDALLDRVHGASDDLAQLHNDWQSVEDRGESLKGAAQRLLEERVSTFFPSHITLFRLIDRIRIDLFTLRTQSVPDSNTFKNWSMLRAC